MKNSPTHEKTSALAAHAEQAIPGRIAETPKIGNARPLLKAQQTRSRKTSRALLDAGFCILEEEGLSGLTIPGVSSRAGVSVGTVYRRFGDKEGLLTALLEEFTTSFRDEAYTRMHRDQIDAATAPFDAVRVAVHAIVETYRAHERLMRVFVTLGQDDPATFHQGRQVSHEGRLFFCSLLRPSHELFTHPDSGKVLDFAYRLVYATCTHRVVNGANLESPTDFSWDDLADGLTRTVSLLLFGELRFQN
ncbi:TetR/AcrR family transcriptional regulator [Variovorax sp. LT1R16]|uniref:TetR/AcrR family transcriptional regulator n=1 Tax=Variovorax sp. LT1R16 TaxID=3443728 RepID=UPI003F469C35